ncbi:MAG: ABC transporter permease [Acholeplasmataceae bacterium]|nr:ABC transporter permease [Acholeplasmataceae bacterium]
MKNKQATEATSLNREARKKKILAFLKNILINHNYIFSLIILLIIGQFASSNFLSWNNVVNLVKSSAIIGIIALGMTLIILSGNIDLSVGSVLALVAANSVLVFNSTESVILTLLFSMAFGALLGFINGFFVGKAKVASFIVTLATMTAFRSLTIQLGDGGPLIVNQDSYYSILREFGYGKFLDIPYLAWIFMILTIFMVFIMTKTKFGRYVYAVGSNERASKLSGISVDWIKVAIFTVSGILTGIAAFLYISRYGSVDVSTAGKAFELDAIAAVAIGGTSMAGGKGFVQGTFFGIIVLYAIDSILTAFHVPAFVNDLIKGILILGAVLLQRAINRRKKD